jgi:hypothetical protein
MLYTQNYNGRLILIMPFGKYEEKSIDQIPLSDFDGFSYLRWLCERENISRYDREQISNVIIAFEKFPVEIKCIGFERDCNRKATNLVLPWEEVHKHEMQRGPEMRKQTEVIPNFLCEECGNDYREAYAGGSRTKGIIEIPINFSYLDKKNIPIDVNLNRRDLHRILRKISYEVLPQGLYIENLGDIDERVIIDKKSAKEIVNKLLGFDEENQLRLFEIPEMYEERYVYFLKKIGSQRTNKLKF